MKSDLGSEFIAEETRKMMSELLGLQEHVPKGRHISKIENAIREVCSGARALLSAAGLPAKLWPFAMLTYVHNRNIKKCPEWAKFLDHKGMLHEEVAFGELVFSKLGEDLQAAPKSAEKGAPVCYLGPCANMRKGANIIYVTAGGEDAGKYHYSTCLHKGLHFEKVGPTGEVKYAFRREYVDLVTVSAPGEELKELGAKNIGVEPEMQADPHGPINPSKAPHAENKKSAGKKAWWTRPNSNCLACRRRSRNRTYGGNGAKGTRCRWSGLSNERVARLRTEGVRVGTQREKEELMEEASNRMIDKGESWNTVLGWFIKAAKEMRANREKKLANSAVNEFMEEAKANLATLKMHGSPNEVKTFET